ncbi:hypothetical protein MHI32_06530 [Paenibacillus sp. FSL H7-0690]
MGRSIFLSWAIASSGFTSGWEGDEVELVAIESAYGGGERWWGY